MTRAEQIAKIKEGFTPPFRYVLGYLVDSTMKQVCKASRHPDPEAEEAIVELITDLLNETIEP